MGLVIASGMIERPELGVRISFRKAIGVGSLFIMALLAAACGGGSSGSSSNTPPPPATLSSISVAGSSTSIAVGGTDQFTATGKYSDGSTKSLTSATWSSSASGVATVSSTGLATGVAAGSAMITATVGSISGNASLTVTKPVTLTSIAITPSAPTLFNGTTLQLTATGTYSDNSTQNLTGSVSWASMTPAIATVSNTAPLGVVTAVALGTTTITATSGSPNIASPAVTVTVLAAEHAYAANFGDGTISQFNVTNGGGLTKMSTATVTAGPGPFSIAIDPSKRFAYVANYGSDTHPNTTVSQYTIAATGGLTPMSPAATVPTDAGPNGVTATANSVYVANYNAGTVTQYTIQADGSLAAMATPRVPTGAGPSMVAITPSGAFAYVPNATDGSVSGYSVNSTSGALTSLGAAYPAGTGADFVAIDPSGKYAYVANSNGGSISQYAINATTGSLSPLTPATVTTINPGSIAIDPKGPYVYVANGTSSQNTTQGQSVSQYTIAANGALTPMTPATVAAGLGANSVTVDPTNQYVYVTNRGSATTPGSTVSQYSIGSTGGLTPLSSAPTVMTGSEPAAIAVSTAN